MGVLSMSRTGSLTLPPFETRRFERGWLKFQGTIEPSLGYAITVAHGRDDGRASFELDRDQMQISAKRAISQAVEGCIQVRYSERPPYIQSITAGVSLNTTPPFSASVSSEVRDWLELFFFKVVAAQTGIPPVTFPSVASAGQ